MPRSRLPARSQAGADHVLRPLPGGALAPGQGHAGPRDPSAAADGAGEYRRGAATIGGA
jgi:hypothetical protein